MNSKTDREVAEAIQFLARLTFLHAKFIMQFLAARNRRYSVVKIPKDGDKKGFRILHIPFKNLKYLQSVILQRVFYLLPVSSSAHCAIPGRSIITNVRPHRESKAFFRIDFKDAFPSVNQEMVIKHLTSLIKNNIKECGVPDALAFLLATLTTHKDSLPQGAPTSPYLLNLVCYKLDQELEVLAANYGFVYTRYADDLYISTSKSSIPKVARSSVINHIKEYGFRINRDKVRYKTGRATVTKITGLTLVCNERDLSVQGKKVSIPRGKIEIYRARIHRAINDLSIQIEEIIGIVAYVTMVLEKLPQRLQKPFRDFLMSRCPERVPRYAHLI